MNGRRSVRRSLGSLFRDYRGVLLLLPLVGALATALAMRTTGLGRPEALVGLLSVSMLLLLLGYDAAWREGARRRLVELPLLRRMEEPPLAPALWLRALLLTAALTLVVLAAARPKGELGATTISGQGVDLVIALDVSNSMRVTDMAGRSRLDAAKETIHRFVDRSEGDRIALVAFAGTAHVMCPFTLDRDTTNLFLDDLDYDSVAEQGTALGAAVDTALARFDPRAEVGQVILLLTDGEDQGSEPLSAAQRAAERGVVLHTIGFGTDAGGAIAVGTDYWGNPIYKRFQGTQVISRLDEQTLRAMAAATKGSYYRADSAQRLEDVLLEIGKMQRRAVRSGRLELREELFAWYLLPALLLLAVEPLVLLRRRRSRP